jgi:hypothetical protein
MPYSVPLPAADPVLNARAGDYLVMHDSGEPRAIVRFLEDPAHRDHARALAAALSPPPPPGSPRLRLVR